MINRLYTEGHNQTISGGWVNGDSNELLRYSVKITAETHRPLLRAEIVSCRTSAVRSKTRRCRARLVGGGLPRCLAARDDSPVRAPAMGVTGAHILIRN
jgi:hypothetical protein